MNTIVNERELDFTDILNQGLKTFFFKIKDIVLIALLSFVPIRIIIVFISEGLPSYSAKTDFVRFFILFLLFFIEIITIVIAEMSIAIIAEGVIDQKHISALDAVKSASSKWGTAITTNVLASIIIIGLTLLLVIPGLIYSINYVFILSVVALRDKYGNEALAYSKKLVEGQWWRVFGIQLGVGIVFGILNEIITYPLSRISDNLYYTVVLNTITYLICIIISVMTVVLFLNNDFVYHRRLIKRRESERLRKIKSAPSIKQLRQKLASDKNRTARHSTDKKTNLKPVKRKALTKRINQS